MCGFGGRGSVHDFWRPIRHATWRAAIGSAAVVQSVLRCGVAVRWRACTAVGAAATAAAQGEQRGEVVRHFGLQREHLGHGHGQRLFDRFEAVCALRRGRRRGKVPLTAGGPAEYFIQTEAQLADLGIFPKKSQQGYIHTYTRSEAGRPGGREAGALDNTNVDEHARSNNHRRCGANARRPSYQRAGASSPHLPIPTTHGFQAICDHDQRHRMDGSLLHDVANEPIECGAQVLRLGAHALQKHRATVLLVSPPSLSRKLPDGFRRTPQPVNQQQ